MPSDRKPTSRRTLKEYLQAHHNLIVAFANKVVDPDALAHGRIRAVELLPDGEMFLWERRDGSSLRANIPKAENIVFTQDYFGPSSPHIGSFYYYYRPDDEQLSDPLPAGFTTLGELIAPEEM